MYMTVADPGFPVGGGVHLLGGDVDLRRGHFSVKMYMKTKELGPIGGHAPGTPPPLDPPMHDKPNQVRYSQQPDSNKQQHSDYCSTSKYL